MTFSLDTDSLERAETRGPNELARTTFAENYQASRAAFVKNDLSIAREEGLAKLLGGQRERAKGLGFDLGGEASIRVNPIMADPMGPGTLEAPSISEAKRRAEYDVRVKQLNEKLTSGQGQFLSIAELRDKVAEDAKRARERAEEISSRAGNGGSFGGFVGSAVGSVNDPINIGVMMATAPLAPASLLRFAAVEAIASGGSEAVIQTKVVPFLMEQGMSREDAISRASTSIMAATLMGGLIGAGIKVGGRAASKFIEKVRGKPQLNLENIVVEYEKLAADGRLSPEQAEAVITLRETLDAQKGNTFGDTAEGIDRHIQNLQAAEVATAEGRRTSVPRPAREGLAGEPAISPRTPEVAEVRARRFGQEAKSIREKYQLLDFEDLLDQPEFREVAGILTRETLDDLKGKAPEPSGQRVTAAIKDLGGIRLDDQFAGELAALGINTKTAPGLLRDLVKALDKGKRPTTVDDLRVALHERGFFVDKATPEDVTTDDVVALIARDVTEGPVRNTPIEEAAALTARNENANQLGDFLADLGIDPAKLSDREMAFSLREKLLAKSERDGLEAHERLLSRVAVDRDALDAESFSRLADDIDARLSEVEGRVTLDENGNVVLNAQESAAFPMEDIKIALGDGTVVSAREVFELQAERAKALDDFIACATGSAA